METLFIGKSAVFLPQTDSTNSYATDMLKNVNLAEGTIIHTANQTHGKGQRGSAWISEPASNLAVSVILKPSFLPIEKQFFLYKIAALACHDTIAQLLNSSHFDIEIKWPNDILVNRKKIAGILIENNLINNSISWCVAGTGINVNQQQFVDLKHATSLYQLAQKPFAVSNVLGLLCRHTEKHYLALMQGKYQQITDDYLKHFFGLNKIMRFEMNGKVHDMFVKGLSKNGLLLLQYPDGMEMEVDVKEVKWLY